MFFPSDAALLDGKLVAQRSAPGWPGEQNKDFNSGEAIGRAIGAAVVAYASTDNFNLATVPANPGGPGNWTGVNPAKGLYGTRTFARLARHAYTAGCTIASTSRRVGSWGVRLGSMC